MVTTDKCLPKTTVITYRNKKNTERLLQKICPLAQFVTKEDIKLVNTN